MKALCRVLFQDIANRWGEKRCRIMDPGFIRELGQHPWSGNVRELRHVLEQVCMRHDKHILTAEELAGIIPPDEPRLEERPVRAFGGCRPGL
ncbi:MAG: hypothetical protein M3436_00485 [Pseudomonadota bacterium]|nr:hypothetical protein [Pseudomonadota bacterium]